jgi:branched-chain amino acid aminotransferase
MGLTLARWGEIRPPPAVTLITVIDQHSADDSGATNGGGAIWRDGQLIDFADATVHVFSHAVNRGTMVFDVLRVIGTRSGPAAVGLRPHVARFDRSLELMGMDRPFDVRTLERAVAETVAANPGASVVKLAAAWVEVAPASLPVRLAPSVYVAALPADEFETMTDPVTVVTAEMPKIPATVLPPSIKVAASYAPAVRHQMAAVAAGYDDVLFRSADGGLAEATTQSLLVVREGRVLVPSLDVVLDGITRRLLLDLAHHSGITVEVRDVQWDEVATADELILTATTRFIRPVRMLDGRELDAPGPLTRSLADELALVVAGTHELSDRWLTPLASLRGDAPAGARSGPIRASGTAD